MIPENIGRYQIEGEIGRGGMAAVFKAYDPRFERHVAVKVLPREFMHDPEFRARFNREAKTIASLEHPAIVPVYDYGEDDGLLYLVMRYMPGGSLADRLEAGPLTIEESAEILQRLGSALDRAHRQGIIHRDLKPSNVLFDQYGDAFLADFGIVRVSDSDSNLTASGSLMGTPMYMSPEQVYGDKELDGRSDIYALGVILFQMLTGHLPYEADTPAKLMMKHILDPVPGLLSERPDLPPEAEEVVSKALAKERDDRFETASDFSSALSTITKEIPVSDDLRQQLADIQADAAPGLVGSASEMTKSSDLPQGPMDQPPSELADDVLASMDLPASKGQPPDSAKSQSKRTIPIWAWIVVVVLFMACIGLCGIVAYAVGTMDEQGVFDELETAVSESTAVVEPTSVEFPLIDPDEVAAATADASLLATREELSAVATQEANNSLVEESVETAPPSEETTAEDPIELTRASMMATRNAVNESEDESADDLAATRDALAVERGTATTDFPLPAVFGPEDGGLLHEADNTVEMDYTGVNLANFIARAEIFNPYPAAKGDWDFGIVFRQEEADDELRLVVRSDGLWNLNNRSDEGDSIVQESTVSEYLKVGDGDSNEIMLVAFDNAGLFFLNGNLVTALDLSTQDDFGEVALGTGFYTNHKQAGEITTYEGFTVWPFVPEFGPRDGELAHEDDGFIKMREANVNLQNFITEAEFVNPYGEDVGTWDWGFSFRALEDEYWLIVDSDSSWTLIDRRPDDDVTIDEGNMGTDFLAGAGEANKLTLIAIDDKGYLLLNDDILTELDLSDRMVAGDVAVMTAFFEGNEVAGNATMYNEFTVWPLP
jgi:serine/threonine protein kinase